MSTPDHELRVMKMPDGGFRPAFTRRVHRQPKPVQEQAAAVAACAYRRLDQPTSSGENNNQ